MAATNRRTRYATHTRHRQGHGGVNATRVLAILVFLGILLYCALAMGLGTWIADRFLTPETPVPNEPGQMITPAPTSTAQVTEAIAFPALSAYAISAGKCETLNEAQAVARGYMERGGAGFIRKDYHVLISAYTDQTICTNIAEKLLTTQQIKSTIYPIEVPAVSLKITATAPRIDGIRDAFSTWQQALSMLDTVWQKLDNAEISQAQALETLRTARDKLESARKAAFEGALVEGQPVALDGLDTVLGKTVVFLATVIDNASEKTMAVSAKIKYTYIASLTEYEAYVKSLGS